MKRLTILAVAAAGLVAAPAQADPSRTVTVDTPRYEGTRTTAYDRDERSLTRDTEVTRKRDGATASSSFERRRTDTGVTRSRSATDFQGRTSSTDYERRRTAHGWVAQGERVQRDGDVLTYRARGVRTERGRVSRQSLAVNGEPVASRRVRVTHGANGTHRHVVRRR